MSLRCERGQGGDRQRPDHQEQQLEQQQLPPPHVVEAPGATVTVSPPVAVVPIWPEKLSKTGFPSLVGRMGRRLPRTATGAAAVAAAARGGGTRSDRDGQPTGGRRADLTRKAEHAIHLPTTN
ncbi:hypothetical protein GCM10009827_096540 [Dactylosporangium maewongense]|uniref:Uncharacterized protein n=1 Tax=Dactylosporangium maewongense TaxID=634393 RepID=A0ABN2CK25_9ACTN